MLGQVGVHIVGSVQVMKVRMEEDFAGLLDRFHDCSKVDSRSWVSRAGIVAIV